jgi:endonuclease YncB( thermonuclease family)
VPEGSVSKVRDGDSFELVQGWQRTEVRIFGIDAPEHGQVYGERARNALIRLLGRSVRVTQVDIDRHGRIVGEVQAGDLCVACELVREGHAWVYRAYTDDPKLIALEAQAQQARRGLWELAPADRVPPWQWRAERRSAEVRPAPSACEPRPRCDRLPSCKAARRALETCGPKGLDGDGDGIPCEKLCTSRLP